MTTERMIRITQVRSSIGCTERQRQSLLALGLKRRGRSVEVPENPMTLGLIRTVAHLVEVSA